MKATDFVSKITQFMDKEKDVYVYIYYRNSDGDVIKKHKIKVDNVFSHERDNVKIYCEGKDLTDCLN